jgi:hypothetical protein
MSIATSDNGYRYLGVDIDPGQSAVCQLGSVTSEGQSMIRKK